MMNHQIRESSLPLLHYKISHFRLSIQFKPTFNNTPNIVLNQLYLSFHSIKSFWLTLKLNHRQNLLAWERNAHQRNHSCARATIPKVENVYLFNTCATDHLIVPIQGSLKLVMMRILVFALPQSGHLSRKQQTFWKRCLTIMDLNI